MFKETKKIIKNIEYRNTLKEISLKANIYLDDFVNVQILNIGENKVKASKLEADRLLDLLFSEKIKIIDYSVEILKNMKNLNFEEGYPHGEEIEVDDEDEDEDEDESLAIISLIGFLIEYYFLTNEEEINALDEYLKKIKLPKRKEHATYIRKIFKEIQT